MYDPENVVLISVLLFLGFIEEERWHEQEVEFIRFGRDGCEITIKDYS
jgi:hypothetical protein